MTKPSAPKPHHEPDSMKLGGTPMQSRSMKLGDAPQLPDVPSAPVDGTDPMKLGGAPQVPGDPTAPVHDLP